MCLARAYLKDGDEEKFLLDDVVCVNSTGNKVILTTILKEEREVVGSITSVDFGNSAVIVGV